MQGRKEVIEARGTHQRRGRFPLVGSCSRPRTQEQRLQALREYSDQGRDIEDLLRPVQALTGAAGAQIPGLPSDDR